MRIERTEGEVLRHALDEPERQPLCAREPAASASLTRRRDVELERVDQFMSDHMIGVGERPAEWQDDAAANRFGDAAGAFSDVAADRVGLLEVRVRGVENQRLTPAQIVVEHAVQACAPAFRQACGDGGRLALLRIEVDVEVVRVQDFECERAVLDLVAAEVLLRTGPARTQRARRECEQDDCECGGAASNGEPAGNHRRIPASWSDGLPCRPPRHSC